MSSVISSSGIFDFEGKRAKVKGVVYFLLLTALLALPFSVELQITKTLRWNFPLELLVPVAALAVIIAIISSRNEFRWTFSDVAVILFLIAAAVSTAFSRIPVISVKALVVLTSYATAFYFGFRFLNLNPSRWRLAWRVLMVSFSLLMLYTLVRYFHLGVHRQHSYGMSLPFVPGHTLLVAVGFPAFLFSLNELLRKENLKFNIPFAALFVFTAAISYSRVYWVILLLFAFVLVFYYFKKIRVAMMVSAVIIIAAGSIVYHQIDAKRDRERTWDDPDDHNSLFVQIQSIFVWRKNESNIERSNRWQAAKEIFKLHPVTGSGLNTYPEIYFWYKDRAVISETNLSCNRMNAHQLYIGWLSDMGITGFAAGIILMLSFLTSASRLRGTPHFVPALLLFMNFAVLGIIEDFTTLEKIMSVFWVSLAYVQQLNSR